MSLKQFKISLIIVFVFITGLMIFEYINIDNFVPHYYIAYEYLGFKILQFLFIYLFIVFITTQYSFNYNNSRNDRSTKYTIIILVINYLVLMAINGLLYNITSNNHLIVIIYYIEYSLLLLSTLIFNKSYIAYIASKLSEK